MSVPHPETDGLFYSAADSHDSLRIGWIANSENTDYSKPDAWIEALEHIKEETPDFRLFMVKRLRFADFMEIACDVQRAA